MTIEQILTLACLYVGFNLVCGFMMIAGFDEETRAKIRTDPVSIAIYTTMIGLCFLPIITVAAILHWFK